VLFNVSKPKIRDAPTDISDITVDIQSGSKKYGIVLRVVTSSTID